MSTTRLEHDLAHLRARLLLMSAAAGIAVDDACEALASGNLGRAESVIAGDASIDALENEIDDLAMTLLARNQPVAQDLRFVIAALRMVTELERIGDEASDIAERVLILRGQLPVAALTAVRGLMESAVELYAESMAAFRNSDPKAALRMCRTEDEHAQMEMQALQSLVEMHGPASSMDVSVAAMHGILISRSLHRICRRAANIAEQTYFMLQGVNIKHISLAGEIG